MTTRPADIPEIHKLKDVLRALGEYGDEPRKHLRYLVKECGAEIDVLRDLVREAYEIEAAGGMTIPETGQRRTVGGIFFHLLKTRLVFPARQAAKAAKAEAAAKAAAPAPPRTINVGTRASEIVVETRRTRVRPR